jgi:hypothetical protein
MTQAQPDFAPLPSYTQTIQSNQAWVVLTLVRTDPDGSKTQVIAIEPKP